MSFGNAAEGFTDRRYLIAINLPIAGIVLLISLALSSYFNDFTTPAVFATGMGFGLTLSFTRWHVLGLWMMTLLNVLAVTSLTLTMFGRI